MLGFRDLKKSWVLEHETPQNERVNKKLSYGAHASKRSPEMEGDMGDAGLSLNAVAIDVPAKADEALVPESVAPKRFRKARRAACAGLAVALAAVGLLVAEILLTNPGRGATKPFHIELFLNQARPIRAPAARRARPDGNAIRSLKRPPGRFSLDRSDSIDRDCRSPATHPRSVGPFDGRPELLDANID